MSEYQPQMAARSAVELVVSVVDVSQSEKVLRLYRDTHVLVDFVCMAHAQQRRKCWICSASVKPLRRLCFA